MKRGVVLTVTAVLLTSVFAQGQTIKQDPIFNDRWNIYENGKREGEIRPDPIFPERFNVYDKNGKRTGRIKKDVIVPDTYQYDRK